MRHAPRLALAAGLLLAAPALAAQTQLQFLDPDGAAGDGLGGGWPGLVMDDEFLFLAAGSRDVGLEEDQGAVVVFRNVGGTWVDEGQLTASDGEADDSFGSVLALDGDVLAVAAFQDPVGGEANAGSVRIFRRSGVDWLEAETLVSAEPLDGDRFGSALALTGDVLAIGENDEIDGETFAGSVSVFRWDGAAWDPETVLHKPGVPEGLDSFGASVAADGDVIAVSAIGDDIAGNSAGAVYVFRWNGADWLFEQVLVSATPTFAEGWGDELDVDGDVLAVTSSRRAIDGNPSQGAVDVFRWNGSVWAPEQTLVRAAGKSGDEFGTSVFVEGDTLVAGSLYDDIDGKLNGGSMTVFRWSGADWVERQTLAPVETDAQDSFGRCVALRGDLVLGSSSRFTVAGAFQQGSAWLFDLSPGPWTELAGGTAGDGGSPQFGGDGPLDPGSPATFTLKGAPANTAMLAWISFAPTPLPAIGGTVQAFPFANQVFVPSGPEGFVQGTVSWPAGIPSATSVWFQMLVADPTSPHGITLSNGLLAVTP